MRARSQGDSKVEWRSMAHRARAGVDLQGSSEAHVTDTTKGRSPHCPPLESIVTLRSSLSEWAVEDRNMS